MNLGVVLMHSLKSSYIELSLCLQPIYIYIKGERVTHTHTRTNTHRDRVPKLLRVAWTVYPFFSSFLISQEAR